MASLSLVLELLVPIPVVLAPLSDCDVRKLISRQTRFVVGACHKLFDQPHHFIYVVYQLCKPVVPEQLF